MRPDTALEARTDLPDVPFVVECTPPFLTARFVAPQRTLGWSLLHPGFAVATDVVWVEVRNSDLGPSTDPRAFLKARLAESGLPQALAFMTSRDIRRHHFSERHVEGVAAACLTTVGLSNGERVGSRKAYGPPHAGTINTLVHVSVPLTDGAMVEALSIVAEARTVAIVDSWRAARGITVTGTGTDCIVVASPFRDEPLAFAASIPPSARRSVAQSTPLRGRVPSSGTATFRNRRRCRAVEAIALKGATCSTTWESSFGT